MENINQISFAIFSFFAFFLALKAFMESSRFALTKAQKGYWLTSVSAFFITNICFLIGSLGFPMFLLIANTALMFYSSNLFLLFRSFRHSIEAELIFLSKVLLVTFAAEFLILLLFDIPYTARYLLVGGTLCVVTCMQLREIIQLIKLNTSIYLKLIGLILGFILTLFLVRLINLNETSSVQYVYQEQLFGMIIRSINSLNYTGLFILLKYYFNKNHLK